MNIDYLCLSLHQYLLALIYSGWDSIPPPVYPGLTALVYPWFENPPVVDATFVAPI